MSFSGLNNNRVFFYRDPANGRRSIARPSRNDSTGRLGTSYLGVRQQKDRAWGMGKCCNLSTWGQWLTSYITDSTVGDKHWQTAVAALLNGTWGFANTSGKYRDEGSPGVVLDADVKCVSCWGTWDGSTHTPLNPAPHWLLSWVRPASSESMSHCVNSLLKSASTCLWTPN